MDALQRDPRTTDEVIADYEERGATTQFLSRPMHLIECQGCGEEVAAEADIVLDIRRVTGDGDDAAVALIECPACVERGVLVMTAGEAMPEEQAGVLAGLLGETEGAMVSF